MNDLDDEGLLQLLVYTTKHIVQGVKRSWLGRIEVDIKEIVFIFIADVNISDFIFNIGLL